MENFNNLIESVEKVKELLEKPVTEFKAGTWYAELNYVLNCTNNIYSPTLLLSDGGVDDMGYPTARTVILGG